MESVWFPHTEAHRFQARGMKMDTKVQQKEQAIRDLTDTYFCSCTGVETEQEAREYAEHVWDTTFAVHGFGPALGAVTRAKHRYSDM